MFYYDTASSRNCTLRKTMNAACTFDFECNSILGLTCISGSCQCNYKFKYWNSTYNTGISPIVGRCQNKKAHGTQCSFCYTGSNNGINNHECWAYQWTTGTAYYGIFTESLNYIL